jgi:YD repeat-containing protein
VNNGVPIAVVDGLSGVREDFTYVQPDNPGAGRVANIKETNGSDDYTVFYSYNLQSDLDVKTYRTPVTPGATQHQDRKWQFSDYISLGGGQRVPQTMSELVSTDGGATWNPSTEVFQYAYDGAGRLVGATFAMTPQTGRTDYTSAYPAASRGRAFYDYDAGGRLKSIEHYWDMWADTAYSNTAILANHCDYDPVKDLKTQSIFYAGGGGSTWTTQRTETYSYDADLDYLTQANYGDGLSNAVQSWTYDTAGNRASDSANVGTWVYDALNRITASPGLTRSTCPIITGNSLGG